MCADPEYELEDITSARIKLSRFRSHMWEIQRVLEAIKEDELADFNPEDFKRLGKEGRDFRRRKSKDA